MTKSDNKTETPASAGELQGIINEYRRLLSLAEKPHGRMLDEIKKRFDEGFGSDYPPELKMSIKLQEILDEFKDYKEATDDRQGEGL